jgi:hypothetical protein
LDKLLQYCHEQVAAGGKTAAAAKTQADQLWAWLLQQSQLLSTAAQHLQPQAWPSAAHPQHGADCAVDAAAKTVGDVCSSSSRQLKAALRKWAELCHPDRHFASASVLDSTPVADLLPYWENYLRYHSEQTAAGSRTAAAAKAQTEQLWDWLLQQAQLPGGLLLGAAEHLYMQAWAAPAGLAAAAAATAVTAAVGSKSLDSEQSPVHQQQLPQAAATSPAAPTPCTFEQLKQRLQQ